MEGFEQLKEQAMFYISHSPEYARQYTEFFNEHILDIGKSFYPDDINTPANQTKIALIVSVGAVLLVLILLNITFSVATKLFSGSQKDRSTKKYNKAFKKSCILLGNSGSGKTLLFSRLVFGRDEELEVHTSQTPNSSIWVHDPKSRGGIGLIDTPSNKKVSGCWEKLVAEGTGTGVAAPSSVVFVIDSASFNDNKMLVSENLYDVLANRTVIEKQLPVHIFCNKCDLPTKASLDEIKKDLEVELTDLRKSYLASEDNCDKDIMDSENDDAAFTFDDALCDVSFSTGSVRTYDMNDLLDFIKN